jgi:hypothetical protein
LNDKTFPALIDNWYNETDIIDKFLNYLVNNILYVVDNAEVETFKTKFPSTAVLVEVKDGSCIIRHSPEFNQKRKVDINIINLPPNTTMLYHTNLLVINKYYETVDDSRVITPFPNPWFNDFNISEKISSIEGMYNQYTKSISIIKIIHTINTQHVSIPIEVYEKLGEDNRKFGSISYRIRSHFANGSNMFKPKCMSFILYKESVASTNILYENITNDNFHKLANHNEYCSNIDFLQSQNDTRFTFNNPSNGTFLLKIVNDKFNVEKGELIKDFKPNKIFVEQRHKESGFISLYDRVGYDITYYSACQVVQKISPSGDKTSTTTMI